MEIPRGAAIYRPTRFGLVQRRGTPGSDLVVPPWAEPRVCSSGHENLARRLLFGRASRATGLRSARKAGSICGAEAGADQPNPFDPPVVFSQVGVLLTYERTLVVTPGESVGERLGVGK